jgi:hypothetical protein
MECYSGPNVGGAAARPHEGHLEEGERPRQDAGRPRKGREENQGEDPRSGGRDGGQGNVEQSNIKGRGKAGQGQGGSGAEWARHDLSHWKVGFVIPASISARFSLRGRLHVYNFPYESPYDLMQIGWRSESPYDKKI